MARSLLVPKTFAMALLSKTNFPLNLGTEFSLAGVQRMCPVCGRWPASCGPQAVDVLVEVGRNGIPHRIEDEVDAFPACLFCGGNEVGISCDEDDLIDLSLESQRGDVESDLHVDSFLTGVVKEVLIGEIGDDTTPTEEFFELVGFELPFSDRRDVTQPKGDLAGSPQFIMERQTEGRRLSSREVETYSGDWPMHPLLEWWAIIEEYSIQMASAGRIIFIFEVAES